MKYILVLLTALCPYFAESQRLHLDIYAGFANYQGDLQSKKFTFTNIGPAVGLGLSYNITNKLALRGAANYLKLKGDDKTNDNSVGIAARNLSFQSHILEAQLGLEYNFFDLTERSVTPYVFAGVAAFHFNPYAYDTAGTKVYLRPLSTEGQGLAQYPDRKMYKNNQLAIPFGGGLKFAITERFQVGAELALRKLFTDYLDDVSTTYVDSATLFAAKGPRAVEFAYRGSEVHNGAYPAEGSQRGNAAVKDWYYSIGIRIKYQLKSSDGNGSRKLKGCPTNVY
jgi:opacity protein-like surface antigen